MNKRLNQDGFTLIEVTFATGILLLSFGLVLGAMFSLTRVREINEARLRTLVYLNDQLERVRGLEPQPAVELLSSAKASAPPRMALEFRFVASPGKTGDEAPGGPRFLQVTASTTTTRGYPVSLQALCALGGTGGQ